MTKAGLAVACALLVACDAPAAPPSASPAAPAVPTASAAASAGGAPGSPARPSPEPTARPGIRATPAGTLPESFRYVALDAALADGFRTRLWLVDLAGRRAPAVVAEWDGPAAPVGGYSISADGRTVLISAAGARSRVALYLFRPEAAEVRVLFEEPDVIVISPRVSPDGQRFAFTKYPADGGSDLGLWSGPTAGGELRQIAERTTATNVPLMALAWSVDAAWVAFTRELDEGSEVRLAQRDGGAETVVGPGDKASWRRNAPELLVAVSTAPASRAYTFDLATRKTVEVVRVEKLSIPVVEWHPALDRFAYVASEGAGREASGGIWIRAADGSGASRLDVGLTVLAPQWSRDGSMLTALGGGSEALVPIVDLLSGRRVSVVCRRGGTPPADCL